MQLITNRIHTGKAGRFEDFIAKYKKDHQIKTASTEEDNVKMAAEQEEADSSGQLDVEPLHQKGESTEMPKKGPSAKKEGVDGKEASATDTDPEKEGKDSGQPKAEGSEKFTNKVKFDPNDTPDSEKGGSAEGEVKKASGKCDVCGCDPCECNKEASTKEAGKLPEALEEHKFTKKDDTEVKEKEEKEASSKDDDKEEKEVEAKEEEKEEKEAKAKVGFVKLSNLDSKNKKFLTDFWRQLYGEEYVNALVADK